MPIDQKKKKLQIVLVVKNTLSLRERLRKQQQECLSHIGLFLKIREQFDTQPVKFTVWYGPN